MMLDILLPQLTLQQSRQAYIVATVIEILGSSSAKPAAKALIDANGQVLAGWVGGGCAQAMVVQAARESLQTGEPCVIEIDLTDEIFGAGMPCGGHMRVYIEPVLPKPMLWLVGHGRIVETLCEFAAHLGFAISVLDAQASPAGFAQAEQIIDDDPRYQQLLPQASDFVVIATHHKADYLALSQALQSQAAYIALVASRQRAQLVLKRLATEGFTQAQLGQVRAPAGLDLAARLPEEIALAIVSEIVACRRGGSGRPLSQLANDPPNPV